MREPRPSVRNEIIIVVLALVSVALMIIDLTAELNPADRVFLDRVDLTIAAIFLIEWFWRFAKAESRWTFTRKYWWELLASIPLTHEMTQSLRGLRLLRVVRIFRLLRLVRLATRIHILARHSRRLAGDTYLVGLATTASVIVLSGTLAFHLFEASVNEDVHNLFDSFWWAMCTVTTVGYGDISPVTIEGRLVGIFLMLFGAGVMAAFTALVASHLVRSRDRQADRKAAAGGLGDS